jgi:hypothetical protein
MGPLYPLHTPFNSAVAITGNNQGTLFINNVTQSTLPHLYNATNPSGTLTQNLTTSVHNATNSNILSSIFDPFYILSALWAFIQFVTGGFAFAILGLFGFPSVFIYGMQALYGFVLVRTLIYMLLGR